MTGFPIATAGLGIITLQARQRADNSYVQEIDVAPARRTPVGPPEELSVGVGAVVTLSPPGGATTAQVYIRTAQTNYYEDGSTPTTGATGNGAPAPADSAVELDLASFANFKIIGATGTAKVTVLYGRYGS